MFLENFSNGRNQSFKGNNIILTMALLLLGLLIISLNLPSVIAMPGLQIFGMPIPRILILVNLFFAFILMTLYLEKIKLTIVDFALLLYLMMILLSALSEDSNLNKIIFYGLTLFSPYFIGRIIGLFDVKKFLFIIITLTALIQIVLIIYSYFFHPFEFTAIEGRDLYRNFNNKIDGVDFSRRAAGTIGHPVVLATFLTFPTILWGYLFLSEQNKLKRNFLGLLLLIGLFCIFLTYSRGTWLILLVLFAYLAFKLKFFRTIRSWLITLITIVILFFTPLSNYFLGRLSLTTINDGSVSHRLYMFYWSFKEAIETPIKTFFGGGIGSANALLIENPPPDYFLVIDNIYLLILVELGLVGLILILIVLIGSLGLKGFYRKEINIVSFIIVGVLINGISYDLFDWEQISILLWFLIGINVTKKSDAKLKLYRRDLSFEQ